MPEETDPYSNFSALTRRDQRDLINIPLKSAEEALKTYECLHSNGLLLTFEAKMRQMDSLQKSEAALTQLEERLLPWIQKDEDFEADVEQDGSRKRGKSRQGSRKAKMAMMEAIVRTRRMIAQTTHQLAEPNGTVAKMPLTQKNTQNNYFVPDGKETPNPKADFEQFKTK